MTAMTLSRATTMRAIVHRRYGSPDVLEAVDLAVPAVADDGVLVRVAATSVNPMDWHLMRGEPYLLRLTDGLRRPKKLVAGTDVAGTVIAVGRNVTQFAPGDEVYGAKGGAFAEFVMGREVNFVPKPARLSMEQAAAIPVAGCTALQALRDKGRVQSGERVLVNGAAGGVGTFAVQLARAFGAEVTAVCGPDHVAVVRSIGAHRVIDYSREDFTRDSARYDLIIDVAGSRSLRACRRVMTPTGRLVVVGGPAGRWLGPMIRPAIAPVLSRLGTRRFLPFLARISHADLLVLNGFIEAGTVTPVVDRTYPLGQIGEAVRYVEAGHAGGKVVVTI